MSIETTPKFRVTAANLQALRDAIGDLNDLWENIDMPIETWLDNPRPTDPDEREERRDARAEIDDNLPELIDAIASLAKIVRLTD